MVGAAGQTWDIETKDIGFDVTICICCMIEDTEPRTQDKRMSDGDIEDRDTVLRHGSWGVEDTGMWDRLKDIGHW